MLHNTLCSSPTAADTIQCLLPVPIAIAWLLVCTCLLLPQHGVDYTEEIPPLALTEAKEGATLAVSVQWLQHIEKVYQAKSSTSIKSPVKSVSACKIVCGDAMTDWLFNWQPFLPHKSTLPGESRTGKLAANQLESADACGMCSWTESYHASRGSLSPA